MDSPVVTQLFRQLFRHRACQTVRSHSTLPLRRQHLCGPRRQWPSGRRAASGRETRKDESHWQQRTHILPQDMSHEFSKYPMVTADQLRTRKERPRRVKMLMRDFIEGSLSCLSAHTEAHAQPRQSIQPLLRVLLETSRHLHAGRTVRLPQPRRRARIL